MEAVPLKSTAVTKLVEPFVDCGRLLLIDRDPVPNFGDEDELIQRARNNTQYLFNKIWELNKKRVDEAIVAVLPKPVYRVPREKILPDKRQPTKWEKYAKEKGIRKKKLRGNKVFDAETGEWRPRFGYRRAENMKGRDWLLEVPDDKAEDTDMFAEQKKEKQERTARNELQRLRNEARNQKAKKGKRGPRAPDEMAKVGIAKDITQRDKQELRVSVDRARVATASVGKFQPKIHGEKTNTKTGKKRKFEPNIAPLSAEKERALSIAKGVQNMSKQPKLLEHKIAATAGPIEDDRNDHNPQKKKRGGDTTRQKNVIHRQKHFQTKKKTNLKTRGNVRTGTVTKGKKGKK